MTTTFHLLCCTANMGNAPPTAKDVAAWIPPQGRRRGDDDSASGDFYYDAIAVGMQEATWKTKNDKKGQVVAVVEEEEHDSEEDEGQATSAAMKTQASDVSDKSTTSATTSNGTLQLRQLLQECTGEQYKLVKEFLRGQMRLYLLVRLPWVSEISQLEVKAENTGIGHVYHNKGGILLQFVVRQSTRLTIATAHLAAHEGITHYRARNDSVREILRGARPNPKHLVGYDAATVSHHMFFMGDLNYRVRMPPPPPAVDSNGNVPDNKEAQQQAQVQRALNLVQAGDYETLYQYDELSAGLKNKEVLCQFQTLPCQFSPTFKMLRQEGFHYKTQRIPSYTDRILFASAEHMGDKLKPLEYEPCPGFASSDHKPIRGAFAIELNETTAKQEEKMTEPVSLIFRNMKCRDLPPMDVDGLADPYVMFVCDPLDLVKDDRNPKDQKNQGNCKWPRTSYVKKTLNPVWDEQVKLCIPSGPASQMNGAMLFITIMDYDMSSADDTVSTLALNLQELVTLPEGQEGRVVQINRPLLKYGKEQGMIECTIEVQAGGIEFGDKQVKKKGLLSRITSSKK